MHNRKGPNGTLGVIASCTLLILLFLCVPVWADSNNIPACKLEGDFGKQVVSEGGTALGSDSRGIYEGLLRIYVVELEGSYNGSDQVPWSNYFLGWALDSLVNLDYQENFSTSVNYAPLSSQPDLEPDNVKVIAVMFDKATGYPRNGDPYNGQAPFTAYFADACAAALPGETGYNSTAGGWTHTVFAEEYSSVT